ncbi:hypothetical protein Tco_0895447 [Tanacetum coccineum]|uniref:Uncharacterized protein n=1 Tax=Tanacetum coccineum TaxID=301880 RepID=A0ABQ5CEM1_9ASTR
MDRSLQPQLKLPNDSSPIVDHHLFPDGTMLAYVKNHKLHALDLLYNISKRLTSGANGTTKQNIYFALPRQSEIHKDVERDHKTAEATAEEAYDGFTLATDFYWFKCLKNFSATVTGIYSAIFLLPPYLGVAEGKFASMLLLTITNLNLLLL